MAYYVLVTLSGLMFMGIFTVLPNAGIPLMGSVVLTALGLYGLLEESRL